MRKKEKERKEIIATKEGQGSIGQHWNLGTQTKEQKNKRNNNRRTRGKRKKRMSWAFEAGLQRC